MELFSRNLTPGSLMKNKIHPIILAGGSGERLWPLSRESYPKQFTNFLDNQSLFQKTVLRLRTDTNFAFAHPLIITNQDYRFIVANQLEELRVKNSTIIIEPEKRNTAPAILAASLMLYDKDPESVLLVTPSDHLIRDIPYFHKTVDIGIPEVEKGNIVTFGVKPNRAETGYGYLELSKPTTRSPVKLKQFIEKPSENYAKQIFQKDNILWNSGVFLFKAKDIINAFKTEKALMTQNARMAVKHGKQFFEFFLLDQYYWSSCENISIDYAIMENAQNLMAVPFNSEWVDLGDWAAVWENKSKDENGLVQTSNVTAIDCKNSLLFSENENIELTALGLENIIAVSTPDAVLVMNKEQTQNVKQIVTSLKKKGASQATQSIKDKRPWGWFETVMKNTGFQVKLIHVAPGSALSLQSHKFRSEHWVVVEGEASVTIEKCVKILKTGESAYIPQGSIHRLENNTSQPLELIEVQIGTYLGEDDIIRYEDKYLRD